MGSKVEKNVHVAQVSRPAETGGPFLNFLVQAVHYYYLPY